MTPEGMKRGNRRVRTCWLKIAAGVTDRVWDMTDIAALIAAQEALFAKRGLYKKKAA
jgi:hypothetical protein